MDIRWQGRFIAAVTKGPWEYVHRTRGSGAAVIHAVTDEGELVLVDQYRVPLGCRCLELPAGLVGDDVDGEASIEAARRELLEETGFEAGDMIALGRFASTPGLASETFTLFRARQLRRVAEGGGVDGEDIRVRLVPLGALAETIAAAQADGMLVDKALAGWALMAG